MHNCARGIQLQTENISEVAALKPSGPEDLFELSWFLMPGPRGEEHIFLVQIPDADEVVTVA